MPDARSKGQLAAWRAFLEVHSRIVRRLEAELGEHCDLPLTWFDVLVQLSEAPEGALRMHELADRVLLSRSGLTRLVDRMERRALVTRRAANDDRRGTHVMLTDMGRAMLSQAAPVHLYGVERHFLRHLSTDEARVLSQVFERILDEERAAS